MRSGAGALLSLLDFKENHDGVTEEGELDSEFYRKGRER